MVGTTIASTKRSMIIADMIFLDFLLLKFMSASSPERLLYMKLPIFTTIVLLSALIWFTTKRSTKKMKEEEEKFWEREREANFVRKKPLTDLVFITIPISEIPLDADSKDPLLKEYAEKILAFQDKKLVNLNGISNTDLKLKYGVSNLTTLSEYDENYTVAVSTLADYAEELNRLGRTDDARCVLEIAINCKSDVKRSYLLLADIYRDAKEYDKIEDLIETASGLTSSARDGIVAELKKRSIFAPSYEK